MFLNAYLMIEATWEHLEVFLFAKN
jgi:hypothetical protein